MRGKERGRDVEGWSNDPEQWNSHGRCKNSRTRVPRWRRAADRAVSAPPRSLPYALPLLPGCLLLRAWNSTAEQDNPGSTSLANVHARRRDGQRGWRQNGEGGNGPTECVWKRRSTPFDCMWACVGCWVCSEGTVALWVYRMRIERSVSLPVWMPRSSSSTTLAGRRPHILSPLWVFLPIGQKLKK